MLYLGCEGIVLETRESILDRFGCKHSPAVDFWLANNFSHLSPIPLVPSLPLSHSPSVPSLPLPQSPLSHSPSVNSLSVTSLPLPPTPSVPSLPVPLIPLSPTPSLQCVLDGDLCEQFNSLEPAKKRSIAEDLDRTPNEVSPAPSYCV